MNPRTKQMNSFEYCFASDVQIRGFFLVFFVLLHFIQLFFLFWLLLNVYLETAKRLVYLNQAVINQTVFPIAGTENLLIYTEWKHIWWLNVTDLSIYCIFKYMEFVHFESMTR